MSTGQQTAFLMGDIGALYKKCQQVNANAPDHNRGSDIKTPRPLPVLIFHIRSGLTRPAGVPCTRLTIELGAPINLGQPSYA